MRIIGSVVIDVDGTSRFVSPKFVQEIYKKIRPGIGLALIWNADDFE